MYYCAETSVFMEPGYFKLVVLVFTQNTRPCVPSVTHTYALTHTHTHTDTHTHTHTCTLTRTHIYMHTYTQIHAKKYGLSKKHFLIRKD